MELVILILGITMVIAIRKLSYPNMFSAKKAQKYYGFLVLDPPIVPDLDKKVKPKRAIICILSVFVAFFISVFLAFFLEFIKKIKVEDPERYGQIVDGVKLWKRRRTQ